MANAVLWQAAFVDRSNILSTELNNLANAAYTNAGTEIANQTNLDQYGKLELAVTFGSAPAAGGYINIYMLTAPDGTNYEDGSSSVVPESRTFVCQIGVRAVTAAQRLTTPLFMLLPAKTKFILENKSGVAFPASGSTVKLYTSNDEVQ